MLTTNDQGHSVEEAHSNCLYYLVKLGISAVTESTKDKEVRQHYTEAQRYLLLLRA